MAQCVSLPAQRAFCYVNRNMLLPSSSVAVQRYRPMHTYRQLSCYFKKVCGCLDGVISFQLSDQRSTSPFLLRLLIIMYNDALLTTILPQVYSSWKRKHHQSDIGHS